MIKQILFTSLATIILSGCTAELWDNAKGLEERAYVRINSITGAYKNDSGSHISVCMTLFDHDTGLTKVATLNVPLLDKTRWNIRDIKTKLPNQKKFIEYNPTQAELLTGCKTTGIKINLLEFSENLYYKRIHKNGSDLIQLSQTTDEAVYVFMRYNYPVYFSYVSKKPIIQNEHTINVPLNDAFNYSVKRDPKPYLYMLTPVSIAFDIVGAAAIVVVAGPMCFDAKDGCF